MKKIFACLLILCMISLVVCACADNPPVDSDTDDTLEFIDTNDGSTEPDGSQPVDSEPDDSDPEETKAIDLETESPDPEGDGAYTPKY